MPPALRRRSWFRRVNALSQIRLPLDVPPGLRSSVLHGRKGSSAHSWYRLCLDVPQGPRSS
eukprot:9349216-Alexandrium_andersonii.AAC.1